MTTRGHLIFAQNSDVDYVRQAYALALSIKHRNKVNQTCLMTTDIVPDEYKKVFDYIVEIPWGDQAIDELWKIQNRWKMIYASPFDETIAYDSDMLLFSSNDYWWNLFSKKDIVLTKTVVDYRGNPITNSALRKSFYENDLPDLYFGIHYFKKTKRAYEFYRWLETIIKNWKYFYDEYTPKHSQIFCSFDVSASIVTKILDAESEFTLDTAVPSFVHMKKELQGWENTSDSWTDSVIQNFSKDAIIKISNYNQRAVFHYTEEKFLSDNIIKILEKINE